MNQQPAKMAPHCTYCGLSGFEAYGRKVTPVRGMRVVLDDPARTNVTIVSITQMPNDGVVTPESGESVWSGDTVYVVKGLPADCDGIFRGSCCAVFVECD